jgi:transposase
VPVVLVLDRGPVHTSKASRATLAERPWITVEWLPRHSPDLNAIERSWRDLKRHHLAHRTFKGMTDLASAIHDAAKRLKKERMKPILV